MFVKDRNIPLTRPDAPLGQTFRGFTDKIAHSNLVFGIIKKGP